MQRVKTLRADSRGLWGKMTVDQMLHHVNLNLAESLGEYKAQRSIKGVPEWLIRFVILYGPWGKGAPTRPDMLVPAGERFDFVEEHTRLLSMIDHFCKKPLDGTWPRTANFAMTGKHWAVLEGRHLDHHLRQFGA
jgi:hypothetical protein